MLQIRCKGTTKFLCANYFSDFFYSKSKKKVIFAIKKPKIWHFVHRAV